MKNAPSTIAAGATINKLTNVCDLMKTSCIDLTIYGRRVKFKRGAIKIQFFAVLLTNFLDFFPWGWGINKK
jgi:hypothetical protein